MGTRTPFSLRAKEEAWPEASPNYFTRAIAKGKDDEISTHRHFIFTDFGVQ